MRVTIRSPQGFVYSVSDDTVIFTKGENKVVYPASTTKLLTAIYSLSVLSKNEIITPSDELELVGEGSSIAYINEGHKISVEMLIECMLLPSGNDAAYVLAAAAGRRIANDQSISGKRAVEIFVNGMNEYARSIGLCGTNFTCPDGYADETHYTTTEDMVIISRLAFENDLIVKYASLYKDDVIYASGHTNTWYNTNKLLDPDSIYYSPYVIGLKTGSLDEEYCLVFAFRFEDGREYVAGVFGHDEKNTRYEDALEIIKALEDN
jgi:D-alanyl-D-alanine carboxypeptidase (penicillin-binding protein 5/6)